MTRFYEDLEVGEVHVAEGRTLAEAEIIDFAEAYDPLPMHTDPAAAEETVHGGLIANGWHTCAVTWRMLVDVHFGDLAMMGGWGLDEVRWPAPVRPGDTLSVEAELIEKSTVSKPDRGSVDYRIEAYNQRGETVLTYIDHVLVERRSPHSG